MRESPPFARTLRLVGYRVKRLRKDRGWSQEDLAGRAGISRTYLVTVERGAKQPTLWTLHRISRALGVPVGELFLPTPEDESSVPSEVLCRIQARLLERRRTLAELRKVEDLIEAFLRKS